MAVNQLAYYKRNHFPLNSINAILKLPDDFTGVLTAQQRNASNQISTTPVSVIDYSSDTVANGKQLKVNKEDVFVKTEGAVLFLDILIDGEVAGWGEYTMSYKGQLSAATVLEPIAFTTQSGFTEIEITVLGGGAGGGVIDPAQVAALVNGVLGDKVKAFTFTSSTGSVGAEMPHNFNTKEIEVVAFDANGVRDLNVGAKPKAGTAAVQNNTSTLFFIDDDPARYPGGKFVGKVYLRKLS